MIVPITVPDALRNLITGMLSEAHTVLPAKVTKVDYNEALLSVKPLLKDKRSPNKILEYPELGDVPLWTYQANLGQARITVPVVVGDIVAVHFCERDTETFIVGDGKQITEPREYAPLGLYPLYATPSIHPIAVSRSFSPTDIVVENGSTTIVVEPSGKVTINTSDDHVINANNVIVNATNMTVNCPLQVNDTVSATGDVHSDSDVTGPTVTLETHVHGGVTTGPSNTGTPI